MKSLRMTGDGHQVVAKAHVGLPFMIPNLMNKFQMSCLRGTLVFEIKLNVWHKEVDMGKT